ncbi:MAG: Wzt carbohydrate-binding domain-containing protein, partial [Desulfotignum sp.]|nr:Wzt carbohydrate-binding domain-containing protein [Desulfotignum sp.]
SVGDAFFAQKCMRFLRRFMKTGTVLFVSHDTVSVKGLCTHALWLEKGRVYQQGSPKEVTELYLEAFFEAQQGKSTTTRLKTEKTPGEILPERDQRMAFINHSNLRNDLKVFRFDPDAASFGKGEAQILDVILLDDEHHPLSWIVGGEVVILRVTARIHRQLDSPIIGFLVKDRLGQTLFGDNTFLTYRDNPVRCRQGETLHADFTFNMPVLPSGEYTVAAAIASGTQEEHEQYHWIHDAIMFKSEATSVAEGLVGIPMRGIRLQKSEAIQ